MNTSGGGLSYCHPGRYGIFLLIEAARQLRANQESARCQVQQVALAHGTGGNFSSSSTVILAKGFLTMDDQAPVQSRWR